MSTQDGEVPDGQAGPVRVADLDARDGSDHGGPRVRVASFDAEDSSGGNGTPATPEVRTLDLDGLADTDPGDSPRRRIAPFAGDPAPDPSPWQAVVHEPDGSDRPRRGTGDEGAGRPGRGGAVRRGRAAGNGADRDRERPSTDPPPDDEARAKEICLRLLTDRARTVKELRDALLRKEIPDDVAHRVLERFDEVGLVDDEAFAGQWVRSRHQHRGLGRRALAQELHRRGVAREVADSALTEIDAESERARARELVDTKIRTVRVGTREERAAASRRLVGMLARKGYGPGVAYSVVRDAIAARGAEEDELGEEPPED